MGLFGRKKKKRAGESKQSGESGESGETGETGETDVSGPEKPDDDDDAANEEQEKEEVDDGEEGPQSVHRATEGALPSDGGAADFPRQSGAARTTTPTSRASSLSDIEDRGNWGSDVEFILAAMGAAIGMGNIFRFPWLLYIHGGGFLVAYWILFFLLAYPSFVMELFIGQFSSLGPVHIWRNMVPCLEGIGWGTVYLQGVTSVYHAAVFSYAVFFMFSSFTAPWKACDSEEWNSHSCFAIKDYKKCMGTMSTDKRWYAKGVCYGNDGTGTGRPIEQLFAHLGTCLQRPENYFNSIMTGKDNNDTIYIKWSMDIKKNPQKLYECGFVLQFRFNDDFQPRDLFRLKNLDMKNVTGPDWCSLDATLLKSFKVWDWTSWAKGIPYQDAHNETQYIVASVKENLDRFTQETLHATEGKWAGRKWELMQKKEGCPIKTYPWAGPKYRMGPRKCQLGEVDLRTRQLTSFTQPSPVMWARAYCFNKLIQKRAGSRRPDWDFTALMKRYCEVAYKGKSLVHCARKTVNTDESFASEEFFLHHYARVLDKHWSDIAPQFLWKTSLSLFFVWVITALGVWKSVKWIGKISYLTAGFPFVMVIVLVIVSICLPGHDKGIRYYIYPELCRLSSPKLWMDALGQLLATNSVGTGAIISLSSYNHFNNDALRDSILITVTNAMYSFVGGFGIFGVLGYMAETTGMEVQELLSSDVGIVFVVFSQATAIMPFGEILSFLFYAMVACLAVDTQFAIVETILTYIYDEVCIIGFALSMPLVSRVGIILVSYLDRAVMNFLLPILMVFTLVGVFYIYGVLRFTEDARMMMGTQKGEFVCHMGNFVFNTPLKWYFVVTWATTLPLSVTVIFAWRLYAEIEAVDYGYPPFGNQQIVYFVVGVGAGMVLVLSGCVAAVVCGGGRGQSAGVSGLFVPTAIWGPSLPENRTGRYAEDDTLPPGDTDENENEEKQEEEKNESAPEAPVDV